jgi:hypothetical protein
MCLQHPGPGVEMVHGEAIGGAMQLALGLIILAVLIIAACFIPLGTDDDLLM